ncbi:hypothetical protein Z969_03915 [Clostridium novyi A str. 4570]|uniref:ATPase dynein-related AAA domain-containing protein n=1 Tax=Clostridium novyi A str. 4570 TaxID=1444290 RepID=A0AA88ZVU2_CLONO|nr:AAA family ATPase [Clostridium novyi]KGN02644.1 hypothetical protein Z969_03915 [Clostridium novyi A str. 4570]
MQINENEKKQIMDSKTCYVVGMLSQNTKEYPGVGEENKSVTVMRGSENIVFYIKALSDEPIPIRDFVNPYTPTEPLYIGIDTRQDQSIFGLDYKNETDLNNKINIIKSKLENKLILFRPYIDVNKPNLYKNLKIINIESDVEVDETSQFICIPKVNYINNAVFEKKLLNGEDIFLEDYNHFMLFPEYILCGDYLYTNFKCWDKNEKKENVWTCNREQKNIRKIKLNLNDENTKNKIITGTNNIIFFATDYLADIEDVEGENITGDDTEIEFLKSLKNYTTEKELKYDIKDLVNFHVSVKTNSLTIISGMSGTGKTQLARSYAHVLGLSEEKGTLLFLPISPSYTEPEDLLGYLNTTNGLYISPESGLVDFLINAEKNPEKLHMVLFDEMNLAQVEHWFAPFISLLELESGMRKLKLYNKNSICHNCEKYKNYINIGDNIIFVGTVNIDETTKEFSSRLLDRSNIITLKKIRFSSLKEKYEENNEKYKNPIYSYKQYSSWITDYKSKSFSNEEIEFLNNLNDIIYKYDDQCGISFRIFNGIERYLKNVPNNADDIYSISRSEAFDIQIKQRLMTKIKGIDRQLKGLLGTFDESAKVPSNSELYDFFDNEKVKKISEFNLTKKEICRKSRELTLYGYAN